MRTHSLCPLTILRRGLLLLAALIPTSSQVLAQSTPAPEPPPSLPLVAAVPLNCAWSLTMGKGKAPAAPDAPTDAPVARSVTRILITKTGNISLAKIMDSRGETTEFYHLGDASLTVHKATGIGQVITRPDFPIYEFYSPGFYGMNHVKVADFQGTTPVEGVACHHYRGTFKQPNQMPGLESSPVTYEAWINAETRLPVLCQENDRRILYTFTAAPEATLTLPVALQTAWAKVQKDAKVTELMRTH